jgi:myosin heavy subunit
VPKGTDTTFLGKLNGIWKNKSEKYDTPRFNEGFILHHYAGKVEYTTAGWLDKNKDPLNDNVTRLLAKSSDPFIASLFADYLNEDEKSKVAAKGGLLSEFILDQEDVRHSRGASSTKKGVFRTAAQRHKEQLFSLMAQLNSTHPHFVRCIIPNDEKKAGSFDVKLILEQLRCNGVLEGIRICRAGFPNRITFVDFRRRYETLAPGVIPAGFIDARKAANILLDALELDSDLFRVGKTKIFFRAKTVRLFFNCSWPI